MSFTGERKGRLIVFEGIDGTGKSTHIGQLRKYLEGRDWKWCRALSPRARAVGPDVAGFRRDGAPFRRG